MRAVAALTVAMTYRERTLLLALAQEADVRGYVSAGGSQAWLAEQCGWRGVESVRVTSKRLVERGLLEVMSRGHGCTTAKYRLPFMGPATS